MTKRILCATLAVVLIVLALPCRAAGAQEGGYEVGSVSVNQFYRFNQTLTTQRIYRVRYRDNGLAQTFSGLTRIMVYSTQSHLDTVYPDGRTVSAALPEDGPDGRSLIGPEEKLPEFALFYVFDAQGNPAAMTMISGLRIRFFSFHNRYENGSLASVTVEAARQEDVWLYDLIGHFTGYRNVLLDFGAVQYTNLDGKLVREKRDLSAAGSSTGDIQIFEYEYENNQLVTMVSVSLEDGVETFRSGCLYDSQGRISARIGQDGTAAAVVYEQKTDEAGSVYYEGRPAGAGDETAESSDDVISCTMHENGRAAEIVWSGGSDSQRETWRYDEWGNEVYQELYVGNGIPHVTEEKVYEYR